MSFIIVAVRTAEDIMRLCSNNEQSKDNVMKHLGSSMEEAEIQSVCNKISIRYYYALKPLLQGEMHWQIIWRRERI